MSQQSHIVESLVGPKAPPLLLLTSPGSFWFGFVVSYLVLGFNFFLRLYIHPLNTFYQQSFIVDCPHADVLQSALQVFFFLLIIQ